MSATLTATANTLSVDTGSQVNITDQNSAESSAPPALAEFNNRVYMAYIGSGSSNLYICYWDGSQWHGQTKITDQNDAKSGSSPALAAFNGRLYLAFRGSGASTNLYICSSADGTNWGSQTKITDQNDAQTSSSPALAAFNGRLYLGYRGWGASTSLYVCSSSNGTSWGSQTNVTDQNGAQTTVTAGPSLAAFGGALYMGYEGAAGTGVNGADLYVCSTTNGTTWGSQTNLAEINGAQGYDGVALAANGSLMMAVYHGAHTASLYGCAFNGSVWSSNQVDFSDANGAGSAWGPALASFQGQFITAYLGIGVSSSLWEFPFTATWNA
jgi:hypothetical protein